jgi:hypothetical protein
MNSADVLHLGAQIDLPTEAGPRRCEVVNISDDGFQVKFYTPEGVGPYFAVLPHGEFPAGTIHRTLYQNEAAGLHKSFYATHPDFKP